MSRSLYRRGKALVANVAQHTLQIGKAQNAKRRALYIFFVVTASRAVWEAVSKNVWFVDKL